MASSKKVDQIVVSAETELAVAGKAILLVNHAESFWDEKRLILPETTTLVIATQRAQIPTIGLLSRSEERGQPFFPIEAANIVVHTSDGHHHLWFPQAQNLIFAGGNLSICLCETIRDTLIGALSSKAMELNVYLVANAIFDSRGQLRVQLPDVSQGNEFTLASLIAFDRPPYSASSAYISRALYSSQLGFCMGLHRRKGIPDDSFKFEYYIGDQLIASEGNDSGKRVRVKIVDLAAIEELLLQWKSEQ